MVEEGSVERLEVGPKRIDCLRLTKYNPDFVVDEPEAVHVREEDVEPAAEFSAQGKY